MHIGGDRAATVTPDDPGTTGSVHPPGANRRTSSPIVTPAPTRTVAEARVTTSPIVVSARVDTTIPPAFWAASP